MIAQTEQPQTEDTSQSWTDAIVQSEKLEGDVGAVAEAEVVAEQDVPEAAAAPPETPPDATPTPIEPVTTPATPTAEETRLQGEVTRLTQERQLEAKEAEIQRRGLRHVEQLKAQKVQQEGLSEDQAEREAWSETQALISEYRAVTATRQLVALQENVPPEVLDGVRDEASMRQKAQEHKRMAGPQREELTAMQQKIDRLEIQVKKAQVPAQSYDQPSGVSGASSDNDTWIKYGRGELEWGPQVQKAKKALGFD